MDDKKKDSDSSTECSVTVVRHGPDCPVTKAFRETAEEIVAMAGEHADGENSGPAKVNSKAFKQGWEGVFGNKTVGQA